MSSLVPLKVVAVETAKTVALATFSCLFVLRVLLLSLSIFFLGRCLHSCCYCFASAHRLPLLPVVAVTSAATSATTV